VVIKDVNSMLSFAAERKGLKYIEDIPSISNWKVMGKLPWSEHSQRYVTDLNDLPFR
jgi:hypothetical protein